MSDSIKLGPGMQAFAKGVQAGSDATDKLSDVIAAGGGYREVLAYYWLVCGTRLATIEDATEDVQAQFMAGASTRAPEAPALVLTVDNIDGSAFGEDDPDQVRSEVARLLRKAADQIDNGTEDATLFDINGAAAGRFAFNPYT